jgi:hypothetical protein
MARTRKHRADKGSKRRGRTSKVYTRKDYSSGDGMLTTVWGPSMWHYLHTMSFNYPVNPTEDDKKHYGDFIRNLQYVLPCRHCRENLANNFKAYPLRDCHLKNRDAYSRYVYGLHETVNKMLGKKSGLKYCDVRERYEHFRARCTEENPKIFKFKKTKKEKGCTEPLYGKKAKCVIKIVPQEEKCPTMMIDEKCVKRRN